MKSDQEIQNIATAWLERRNNIYHKSIRIGVIAGAVTSVIAFLVCMTATGLYFTSVLSLTIGVIVGAVIFLCLSIALSTMSNNPAAGLSYEDRLKVLSASVKYRKWQTN
jgi:pilus assembly protein TadC